MTEHCSCLACRTDLIAMNTKARVNIAIGEKDTPLFSMGMVAVGDSLTYRTELLTPHDIPKGTLVRIELLLAEK